MTIFLVILAILLVGGAAVLASGHSWPTPLQRLAGRSRPAVGPVAGTAQPADAAGTTGPQPSVALGLVEPVASLPPVLLPDDPSAQDVDAVRFGLGLRGYRMDQVDEVLDRLAGALELRDAVIRDLRAQLAGRDSIR